MRTVRVEFDVKVPEHATDNDVIEWVSFEVGASGMLLNSNPMSDRDLEADYGSVRVRWTGQSA
jgi:hypothetical protein